LPHTYAAAAAAVGCRDGYGIVYTDNHHDYPHTPQPQPPKPQYPQDQYQQYEHYPAAAAAVVQYAPQDPYQSMYPDQPHQPHHSSKSFICKECGENEVPFIPGSNLELVWDGSSWTLRLIDNGQGAKRGKAASGAKGAKRASSGSGRKPQDKLASLIRKVEVQRTEDQPAAAAAAGTADWGQDGGVALPYYQGQCVQCPEGSHVEGNMCK
jgi:hypothetical protein